jgi:hypothetical protein
LHSREKPVRLRPGPRFAFRQFAFRQFAESAAETDRAKAIFEAAGTEDVSTAGETATSRR